MGERALPATPMNLAPERGISQCLPLSIATSLVFLLSLTGCVTVVRLAPESFPPSQHVEILLGPPEGRPYMVIAQLSTPTELTLDMAVERLIGKARQLGADAIVVGIVKTKLIYGHKVYFGAGPLPVIWVDPDPHSDVAVSTTLNVTAIRYTDRPAPKE